MLLSLLPHMHLRGSSFTYTAHYPTSVGVSKSPWGGRFHRDVVRRLRESRRYYPMRELAASTLMSAEVRKLRTLLGRRLRGLKR